MKTSLELVALVFSITTFVGGCVMWFQGAVKKNYAAQRDFDHLKNSYHQLASNQQAILKELDGRFDQTVLELKEIKGFLTAIMLKISPSDSSLGSFNRPRE